MQLGTLVKTSFFAAVIILIFGAFQKIMHAENAEAWLIAGVLAQLLFIASAIYEVNRSTRINRSEKTMWTLALLFFSGIAGLVYLLTGRSRVVPAA